MSIVVDIVTPITAFLSTVQIIVFHLLMNRGNNRISLDSLFPNYKDLVINTTAWQNTNDRAAAEANEP